MNQQEFFTIDTGSILEASNPIYYNVIYDLLPENHEKLFTKSMEFDFGNPPHNPNKLASNLVETAKKHGALGLAAIQVGIPYRVFVTGHGDNYVAHFNPRILTWSENVVYDIEGCLSFPKLVLKVPRYEWIDVEYQDFNGNVKQTRYSGLTARVFQHEYDHLGGQVFTKKVGGATLLMAQKKRKKYL